MTYSESLVEIAVGNSTDEPKTPQLEIKNPLQVPVFVNVINLIADSFFSIYGSCRIMVGQVQIIYVKSGKFLQTNTKQIPLKDVVLGRHEKIKVYVWNEQTPDKVTLTVDVSVSDDKQVLLSNYQSADYSKIQSEISDNYVDKSIQFLSDELSGKLDAVWLEVYKDVIVNSDTNTKLIDVKNSVDTENTELKEKLDLIISSTQSEHSDELQTKIIELINSLPDSPDNAGLLTELKNIEAQVSQEHSEDTITKIQDLINALPDSPDNAGLLEELKNIEAQVSQEHSEDTITKIQDLINALPDSPDNAGIIAELQNVIDSVDGISIDSINLISLLEEIQIEFSNSPSQEYLTALNYIFNVLLDLQNGFDIDELSDTIDTIITHIPTIRDNNVTLGDNCDLFNIELETILTTSKLNKSKKGILFPKQAYYNTVVYGLFNTKGYKNLIITMAGSTIPTITEITPPIPETYEVGTDNHPYQFRDIDTQLDITNSSFNNKENFRIFDTASSTNKILNIDGTEPNLDEIFNVRTYAYDGSGGSYQVYLKIINAVYTKTYDIDESDDPTFASGITNILSDVSVSSLNEFSITKRYVRITEKTNVTFTKSDTFVSHTNDSGVPYNCFAGCSGMSKTSRNISDLTINSITDILTVGGTANLSIELKDAFDEWFELVSAIEMGTISAGQKVIQTFGEATGNKALPSTQDSLRFVLSVAGGIETGVSVMRVA